MFLKVTLFSVKILFEASKFFKDIDFAQDHLGLGTQLPSVEIALGMRLASTQEIIAGNLLHLEGIPGLMPHYSPVLGVQGFHCLVRK